MMEHIGNAVIGEQPKSTFNDCLVNMDLGYLPRNSRSVRHKKHHDAKNKCRAVASGHRMNFANDMLQVHKISI